MYFYRSPIGLMTIKYNSNTRKFHLIINDECYGLYNSAVAAADDVYTQSTGCMDWDCLEADIDIPTDIYEWSKVNK